jgi:hypothetical protein
MQSMKFEQIRITLPELLFYTAKSARYFVVREDQGRTLGSDNPALGLIDLKIDAFVSTNVELIIWEPLNDTLRQNLQLSISILIVLKHSIHKSILHGIVSTQKVVSIQILNNRVLSLSSHHGIHFD